MKLQCCYLHNLLQVDGPQLYGRPGRLVSLPGGGPGTGQPGTAAGRHRLQQGLLPRVYLGHLEGPPTDVQRLPQVSGE